MTRGTLFSTRTQATLCIYPDDCAGRSSVAVFARLGPKD